MEQASFSNGRRNAPRTPATDSAALEASAQQDRARLQKASVEAPYPGQRRRYDSLDEEVQGERRL
jgi:hypothetical protein